ncbi:hypothetical protein D3C76_570850 [compost metagenome]
MRGGDVGQAAIRQLLQLLAIHPLLVHRYAHDLATGDGKRVPGCAVPRVFHSHPVTRLQ